MCFTFSMLCADELALLLCSGRCSTNSMLRACGPSLFDLLKAMQSAWPRSSLLLCRRAGSARFGGLVRKQVAKDGGKPSTLPMDSIDEDTMLDEAQFLDLIKCIDKGLRALPATGQVGRLRRFISLDAFLAHNQWRHSSAWNCLDAVQGCIDLACRQAGDKCCCTVHGAPAPGRLIGLRVVQSMQWGMVWLGVRCAQVRFRTALRLWALTATMQVTAAQCMGLLHQVAESASCQGTVHGMAWHGMCLDTVHLAHPHGYDN